MNNCAVRRFSLCSPRLVCGESKSAVRRALFFLFSSCASTRAGQNTEGFRLEQNAPNPFSGSTVIRYAIPAGTLGATLSVYDLTGRMLRSFNLNDGEGAVTINAGDLSDGLYIYDAGQYNYFCLQTFETGYETSGLS